MSDLSNVVQFADLQIARLKDDHARRVKGCQHKRIRLDDVGEVVKCMDCESQVSAYWALQMLATDWKRQVDRLESEKTAVHKASQLSLHLNAAKQVESVWRSRADLPCCPHCDRGIMPEDGLGSRTVSKIFEQGLRVREAAEAEEKGLPRPAKLAPGKPKPTRAPAKARTRTKPPPRWEDAPAWAAWLTQATNGRWTWHLVEPFLVEGSPSNFESGGNTAFAGTSTAPADGVPIKQKRPRATKTQGTAQ
ncbi:hypothetical protein ACQKO6_18030 [Pseudomonas monteilii]